MRRIVVIACLLAVAVAVASPARASEIVARNASAVSLKVDRAGYALVSFREGGARKNVLLWGAVNARPPKPGGSQVHFARDFSGGWGRFHRNYWQTLKNACRPYDGPALAWAVSACKAPDGSYWALQAWQRMLPDYALAPNAAQSVWELHASHWTGAPPQLQIGLDWSYAGHFHHLYGTYTYGGGGVYGFKSTSAGVPLDDFGRNVYVDTFDSAYGSGWKRENSFLTHGPGGSFCYGFYPHGSHPAGNGAKYRITVIGPGVAPDVMWAGDGLPSFDKANAELVQIEDAGNAAQAALHDPKCTHT